MRPDELATLERLLVELGSFGNLAKALGVNKGTLYKAIKERKASPSLSEALSYYQSTNPGLLRGIREKAVPFLKERYRPNARINHRSKA